METSVTPPETQSLLHQPGELSNNWSRQDKKIALFITTTGIFCFLTSVFSFIEKKYFYDLENCQTLGGDIYGFTIFNCNCDDLNSLYRDVWRWSALASAISGIATTGAALITFVQSKK